MTDTVHNRHRKIVLFIDKVNSYGIYIKRYKVTTAKHLKISDPHSLHNTNYYHKIRTISSSLATELKLEGSSLKVENSGEAGNVVFLGGARSFGAIRVYTHQ